MLIGGNGQGACWLRHLPSDILPGWEGQQGAPMLPGALFRRLQSLQHEETEAAKTKLSTHVGSVSHEQTHNL
jgi:hypothetical protein